MQWAMHRWILLQTYADPREIQKDEAALSRLTSVMATSVVWRVYIPDTATELHSEACDS